MGLISDTIKLFRNAEIVALLFSEFEELKQSVTRQLDSLRGEVMALKDDITAANVSTQTALSTMGSALSDLAGDIQVLTSQLDPNGISAEDAAAILVTATDISTRATQAAEAMVALAAKTPNV